MKKKVLEALRRFKAHFMSADKLLHFLAGFFIAGLIGVFNPLWGLLAGLIAGAVKEAYDRFTGKGTPEFLDFAFTAFGAVVAIVAIIYVYLFFILK